MNIYVEIEVFNREFKSRLLLASYAALKNYQVFLMHRSELYDLALKGNISPGIILMKDANSSDYICKKMNTLKKMGFLITAQDEESGILFDDFNHFVKRRFSNGKSFDFIDYFFCWGIREPNILKKIFKKKTKFVNVGSPRIDLLNKKYYLNKNKSNFLQRYDLKKYILLSSNISFPIGLRRIPEAYFFFMESDDDNLHFEWKEDFFFNSNIQQLILLKHYIRLIRYLLKNQNKYSVVIRPHPTERIEDWKNMIGIDSKNLKIIKKNSLSEFIFFSEVLIQNGCTSSIESKILGKKTITFEPIKFNINYGRDFPNSLGKKCTNALEVLRCVKNLDKINFDTRKEYIKELKYRLNYDDQKLSSTKIIEVFDILNKKLKKQNNFFIHNKITLMRKLKDRVKFFLHRLLNHKTTKEIFDEKFPIFQHDEMNSYKKEFCTFDKKFHKIKFEIISDRVLKVYQ